MNDLEVILSDLKRLASEKDGDLINIKPQTLKSSNKPPTEKILPIPDIPEWAVEIEKDLDTGELIQSPQNVLPVFPKRPALVYMPLLLQPSWIPPKGSPDHYIRKFRNTSIISQAALTPAGLSVGLPSGLMARRILLALVSEAVWTKSKEIAVPSIRELLTVMGMKFSGQSHRSTQRNLFQMATMNTSIWFSPTDEMTEIFNGNIFESLQVQVEHSKQTVFSFLPQKVVFSDSFYKNVIEKRSMPFQLETIMKARSPIEHDLLMWLLHRQSADDLPVGKKRFIGYGLLYHQFGRPSQDMKKFKAWFRRALRNVISKFDRKIDIQKNGIVLHGMKYHVKMKSRGWRL